MGDVFPFTETLSACNKSLPLDASSWFLGSSLMVKRKAESIQRGGKAPARPPPTRQPPPPAQDNGDSSDSDVCEIVSPPASTRRQPRRRQQPPQQSPQQPASAFSLSSASSSQPQPGPSAGLLSMMSGVQAGFGLAPPSVAGFGFPPQAALARMQPSNGYNPFLCDPRLLPSAAGLQRGYVGGFPVPPAVGASSGGASSGASTTASVGESAFSNPYSCMYL